jgi:hypothetical protein
VSRRDDAVRHLTGVLLGEQSPPDFTIAQCWPGNLAADPLHTWVAAFVVRSMPQRLREQQLEHARSLLARRTAEGGWPADEALDDVTRTAMFAGVLGMLSPKPAAEKAAEGK